MLQMYPLAASSISLNSHPLHIHTLCLGFIYIYLYCADATLNVSLTKGNFDRETLTVTPLWDCQPILIALC